MTCFRQDVAAFRDQLMSAVDGVGSGLAAARSAVDVYAFAPARMGRYQGAAIIALAYHLIACRKVQDDVRSRLRQAGGRGCGHPHILAYLRRQGQPRQGDALAHHIAHGEGHAHSSAGEGHFPRHSVEGCEVARFVKLPVGGDIRLGISRDYPAARYDKGAVIQLVLHCDRRAHGEDGVEIPCIFRQIKEGVRAAAEQFFLQKKIAERISAQGKFGEDYYPRPLFFRRLRPLGDSARVCRRVRDLHPRGYRGYLYKSVLHTPVYSLAQIFFTCKRL